MSSIQKKKVKPVKAVILAAGLGSRMRPLTYDVPKPLLPVWGKPALEHVLQQLSSWGVKEVLVNTHHEPDPILNYLRSRPPSDLKIQLSYEPEILGTGGALRKIDWFIQDDYFWIVNSDIAFEMDPEPMLSLATQRRPLSVLWMTDTAGPRTVKMNRHVVKDFSVPNPAAKGTYTFCGLQLVSPDIRKHLPDRPFSSIIEAYNTGIHRGKQVMGVCAENSYWKDIGTHEDYISAHREIRQRYLKHMPGSILFSKKQEQISRSLKKAGVNINGFASVALDAKVEKGAVLNDSVLLSRSSVKSHAVLRKCVAGPNCRIKGDATQMFVRADRVMDKDINIAAKELKWNIQESCIQPFAARGSNRTYTRLTNQSKSVVVTKYNPDRTENTFYVRQSRFLERLGIPVPTLIADIPKSNMYIMSDCGDLSLEMHVKSLSPQMSRRLYTRIIETVIRLHHDGLKKAKRSNLPLNAPFSPALYRWERDLFRDQFLARQNNLSPLLINAAMNELKRIARMLRKQPDALLHRDLQSSNILIRNNKHVFIDFQGMRLGPSSYDMASLIYDPYVSLSSELQNTLCESTESPEIIPIAAVQRLAQALGAFGRLSADSDTRYFKDRIPPALVMLKRAANSCNNCSHIIELCDSLKAMEDNK